MQKNKLLVERRRNQQGTEKKKQWNHWQWRNFPTQQDRIHHSLQQRLFRASKKRLGELIMFVGCVARQRISKEKVVFHDELFWSHNFLLYQSSTFFGFLTHFFLASFRRDCSFTQLNERPCVRPPFSVFPKSPPPPPPPFPLPPSNRHTDTQTPLRPSTQAILRTILIYFLLTRFSRSSLWILADYCRTKSPGYRFLESW